MSRDARLIVRDAGGNVLGALPSYAVDSRNPSDVTELLRIARERWGLVAHVLRIAGPPATRGGTLDYVVELLSAPPSLPLRPFAFDDDDHPLRLPWARPGGPAALLAWADATLEGLGIRRTAEAVQTRSWNLSCIFRLETSAGRVWLKAVPPFFAHEGAVLALAHNVVPPEARGCLPPLLAWESGRVLLGDVPGGDEYDAPLDRMAQLPRVLAGVQAAFAGRVDDLLATGAPDWRAPALARALAGLVARADVRTTLDPAERDAADALVAGLPARLSELAGCGLPDTLVHGDFHQGNVRWTGERHVLLDWGDTGAGNPMLDLAAFLEYQPAGSVRQLRDSWCAAWKYVAPRCNPVRAASVNEPIAALRQALIYRTFLDGIEPSERPYHEADVPIWIRRAISAAGDFRPIEES